MVNENFTMGGVQRNAVPIGTIISLMGTTPPKWYLSCDGSVKNIADYPQLAEYFKEQFGSSNYFGGDGTSTFAVPDLRGEFLRGTGTNGHSGEGSGAAVGVHQNATEHLNYMYNPPDGNHILGKKTGISYNNYVDTVVGKGNEGAYYWHPNFDSNNKTVDAFYTSRPTNTSVLYCVKYV